MKEQESPLVEQPSKVNTRDLQRTFFKRTKRTSLTLCIIGHGDVVQSAVRKLERTFHSSLTSRSDISKSHSPRKTKPRKPVCGGVPKRKRGSSRQARATITLPVGLRSTTPTTEKKGDEEVKYEKQTKEEAGYAELMEEEVME